MNLSFKDIWLDYFIKRQYFVSEFVSGDELILNGNECLNSKRQSILKFSKQFINQIESMRLKNYKLKKAKVNFILYWLKEDSTQEVKIILPQLYFEKQNIES
tara:strand:- start:35588 stop:35893 length:306 start_codon:yes stop_codon:yes gene_type:complete